MSHAAPPPAGPDDLPKLRRLFSREVKRNLFEAYLRPSTTVIKIISNSISSSSCPGGEGIQFSPSPKGQHLLAYNSSRIYVVDVRGHEIAVKREFKILRRPAATCIDDEGLLLAVLLTEMQVDIYDLSSIPPKRAQSIILDNTPRAIALSPCGTILAAAYEGGIEVSSLKTSSLSTERRAVKCDAVDSLSFSFDGTQILGTTVHSSQPNTVILTAPYYDPGGQMGDDSISALWTTSILFPNTSRDCSHAVLIQHGKHEEAGWTFTYDRSFETFRAVRIDDLRNGTTYFTGPVPSPTPQAKLLPCTLPAASYYGDLVSAGFQGKNIWLYGVPEDLDAVPDASHTGSESGSNAGTLPRRNSGPSTRSASRLQDNEEAARVPQWQRICDKHRNNIVGGYKVGELEGVSMVKWVANFGSSPVQERLMVAARNVSPGVSITDDEGFDFVDGGRVTLIDFDYSVTDGKTVEVEIEVGTKEPEVLEEEHRDMATEVAIVRRRTVAQQRGNRGGAVMRTTTAATRPPPLPAQAPQPEKVREDDDPLVPRRVGPQNPRVVEPEPEPEDAQLSIEEQEALESPYAHASPRSGTTLRRAATAAAANRRLHPQTAAGPVEYRRADGRTEHPHESDADNWVPPPPPYQKEDPGDLPDFMRHAMPAADGPGIQPPQVSPAQPNTSAPTSSQHPPPRSLTTAPVGHPASNLGVPPVPQIPSFLQNAQASQAPPTSQHRQTNSGSTTLSAHDRTPRPGSRSSRYEEENIYDVSPPDSPRLGPGRPDRVSAMPPPRSVSDPVQDSQNRTVPPMPDMPALSRLGPSPQPPPVLPRIQTTGASGLMGAPPALDLQIPSPSLHNVIQRFDQPRGTTGPSGRRLSNSMTWPTQPAPRSEVEKGVPLGYPYSAPAVQPNPNMGVGNSYHAPSQDQLLSLGSRGPPSQLSGGFHVPRVPVGSRPDGDLRRTSFQRPLSQQHDYPEYPQQQHESRSHSQPQPDYSQNRNSSFHPHIAPGTPVEDIPLIISTPKGVTGAFDSIDRRSSGRRAETPILAPIPRHPRPSTQAAVLRPAADRLDTIMSASSGHLMPPPNGPGPGSISSGKRVPSLNRKQSRAERSAAKNMADAKRRGWAARGRAKGKKSKHEERDFDAASSAAWTDVTTFSHRSLGFGRGGGGGAVGQQKGEKGEKGDKKCVVM